MKGRYKIASNRNSECSSASLLELDWTTWLLGRDMEGDNYLHVYRPSDDTFHRVYCRVKIDPRVVSIKGDLFWTADLNAKERK